ncbi:MAG: hypothetical protein KDB21_20540 [Acidimicrobiales bacterium]|nr:hypothetical protein [Acidimicrobiales bacterium]
MHEEAWKSAAAWALARRAIVVTVFVGLVGIGATGCGDDDSAAPQPSPSATTLGASDGDPSGSDSGDSQTTATPDPFPTPLPATAATSDEPAPLGAAVEAGDWVLHTVDVVDADDAGLLAPISGFPAPGHRFIAVRYELAYDGDLDRAADPFLPRFVDDAGDTFDVFRTTCVLDTAQAPQPVELGPGGRGATAACFEVPTAVDLESATVAFEHFLDGGGELWFAAAG